jgi:hypothetical protein
MKIRNGFVSNSSSSSFMVSFKPKENPKGKITIKMDVDLCNMGMTIRTIKELDKYWEEQYCNDYMYMVKEYDKLKKEIQSGKYVIVGSFSSDSGDSTEYMLCECGIPKNIKGVKVIFNEGGY